MKPMKARDRKPVGEHEFHCCGTRVLIGGGEIKVLTDPVVARCPLHETLYGAGELDKDAVRRSVEMKMNEMGFCQIAVTVPSLSSEQIGKIREIEKNKGVSIAVFSVCNTCADEMDVERISAAADVVCASASKMIHERTGPRALVQLGVAIPVFALTKLGKILLLSYLMDFEENLVAFRTKRLPYLVEGRGPKLKE